MEFPHKTNEKLNWEGLHFHFDPRSLDSSDEAERKNDGHIKKGENYRGTWVLENDIDGTSRAKAPANGYLDLIYRGGNFVGFNAEIEGGSFGMGTVERFKTFEDAASWLVATLKGL